MATADFEPPGLHFLSELDIHILFLLELASISLKWVAVPVSRVIHVFEIRFWMNPMDSELYRPGLAGTSIGADLRCDAFSNNTACAINASFAI